MSELTSLFRFNTNWFGPTRQPSQFISAPLFAWRCIPYTCIIISRKQWKRETAGGTNAIQGNKARAEWKDPGRWHSRLASIKENKKQSRFWRQLGQICLFTLKLICMFEGMHAAKDVSIRKTWRVTTNAPHIEMYLSWACTQCLPPHLSLYLFMFLCFSPPLTHSGSTVKVPFVCSAGAPVRAFSWLSSWTEKMVLSECCQEVVSLYWAVLTEWPVGECVSMPGSQRVPSVDICCVWKSCGVCLWLHLNPPSLRLQPCLAEQTSSSARLACINCPCLARCLLLITLINFNSPVSHHHRSCL